MNKIFSLIQCVLILGCMAIYSSCGEDFLYKEPPAAFAGSVLEGETGVEGLLVGAYAQTTRGEIFGSAMGTDWVYASCASDDCYKGSTPADQSVFNQVEQYTVLVDNSYMSQRWRDCYNGVARCNNTLIFLKKTQASASDASTLAWLEKRAKQVEGEAKYLRAWFHFSTNRVFKNIPYVKTPDEQDGKLGDEIPNKDAGWAEIEADLDFAIANLPNEFPGFPGRATKYAAMTLKAQVFMYQNKLSEAKPLLDAIINSGKYELVTNFYDNYNERTENNKESIFELQCSTASAGQSSMRLTGAIQYTYGPVAAVTGGWGFYQPSQCLVDCFQVDDDGLPYLDITTRPHLKNDMNIPSDEEFIQPTEPVDFRLDWTVGRRGIEYLGWGVVGGKGWIRQQDNGGPFMTKKYMHFQKNHSAQNGSGFNNDRNFRYHRLAHVILWRAECAVEDGELDKARELVNQVRNRAKSSEKIMGVYSSLVNGKKDVFTAAGNPVAGYTFDETKPAANYKTEPYPAGHVAFSTKEKAREAVRMEIRLEFATEGQRFFDLRRWGMGSYTPDYDVAVLTDYIARDSQFRGVMRGTTYTKKYRYWPIPQDQVDIRKEVLTQDPDYGGK